MTAKRASGKAAAKQATTPAAKSAKAKLLAGGNPQIAKADGDAPVQAWIEALPDWKRDIARTIDALIVRTLPGVRKAVRWNSPMYGAGPDGLFLGMHVFAKYVKVAFFRGTLLTPMPPVESKSGETRYLHVAEGDVIDEVQLARWVRAAAKLPGWTP